MTEPNRLLSGAAEQVRAFNHASRVTGAGWEFPSDSYDALGTLAYLVRMLPQALEQSVRPAMQAHDCGRLTVDGGFDPAESVHRMQAFLTDAVTAAAALAAAVDAMHSATSAMGFDTTGLPGFDEAGDQS